MVVHGLVLSACVRTISPGNSGPVPDQAGPTDATAADQRSDDASAPPTDADGGPADAAGTPPQASWVKKLGSSNSDYCSGVAVDQTSGNVVVTGSYTGTVDFGGSPLASKGADIFLVSYTANGAHLWSKRLGGTDTADDRARAVAVDTAGNVFLTGFVSSASIDFGGGPRTGGTQDVFVASYSGAGTHRWSKRFPDTYQSSGNYGSTIGVDASGRVCVGGGYSGAIDFGGGPLAFIGDFNPFVLVLDKAGAHLWSQGATKGSGDFSGGGKAAIAPTGEVYLGGEFFNSVSFGGDTLSTVGGADAYLASFTGSGTHTWLKHYGSTGSDWPYGIAVDAKGNVCLTGVFSGTLDISGADPLTAAGSSDAFVVCLTSAGAHRWATQIGGSKSDSGKAVVVDDAGNLYVGGSFSDTVNLGGGPLTASGASDLFVASYSASGAFRWAMGFGGDSTIGNADSLSAIAVDGAGGVYVVGSFQGTMSLAGKTLTSAGASDGFVLALKP